MARDPAVNGAPEARADAPARRLECGVCWVVYDPQLGDPVAQVRPGTPFELLPEDWCCPNCEAPRHKFMVLHDD